MGTKIEVDPTIDIEIYAINGDMRKRVYTYEMLEELTGKQRKRLTTKSHQLNIMPVNYVGDIPVFYLEDFASWVKPKYRSLLDMS